MAEITYASNAKANTGVALGAVGTGLGAIAAAGGLGAILGFRPGGPPMEPGDRPVTRYEMGLHERISALQSENTLLQSKSYTDGVAANIQRQIDGQTAVNAAMTATMQAQQGQINQLFGITRLVVPNDNVSPGWGRANVSAAPPMPPYPYPWFPAPFGPPPTPPTDTTSAASATTGG